MKHIEKIELRGVVPQVFDNEESREAMHSSEVWASELIFRRGGRYMVEAPSGTGKSSLCSFIFGLRTDYRGEIFFDGEDSRRLDINGWCSLRRTALAYLPQESGLFPEITVMENIMLKNRLTNHKTQEQIMEMLDAMDIAWKADSLARLLSIGQQQRVALVRALCQPFDFLLADEPVSHLDEINNARAAALIDREVKANGAGAIITSVGNRLSLSEMTTVRL